MAQGRPIRAWVAVATAQAVKITQPIESKAIGRRFARNSRQLMATLAE